MDKDVAVGGPLSARLTAAGDAAHYPNRQTLDGRSEPAVLSDQSRMIIAPMRVASIALWACFCFLSCNSISWAQGAIDTSVPGAATQIEVDFWKSAERIGTHDAYRAYLERFPSGLYAALARAALKSADPSTAARADGSNEAGHLATFSMPRPSTAVDVKPGDRLVGPGPITVGWAGSKKQVLVPNGEWIVLAVVDHKSTHARPVQLTSVSLGQFDGRRLSTLLFAIFNRTAGISSYSTWSEASDCEAANQKALLQIAEGPFTLRRCLTVKERSPTKALSPTSPTATQVTASLRSLGATEVGFNLETDTVLVDSRAAFMRIVRLDCVGLERDATKCPLLSEDASNSLVGRGLARAKSYLPLSAEAFLRGIPGQDLRPGTQSEIKNARLPD